MAAGQSGFPTFGALTAALYYVPLCGLKFKNVMLSENKEKLLNVLPAKAKRQKTLFIFLLTPSNAMSQVTRVSIFHF